MAIREQKKNGLFREWISKVFHTSREAESKVPEITEEPNQVAVPEAPTIEAQAIIEATVNTPVEKDTSTVELSDELQRLLNGQRFDPLRKALVEENITTIDKLKAVKLWVFLNQHNLYPIVDRLSVFDYIQDQIHPEPETYETFEPKKESIKSIDNVVVEDYAPDDIAGGIVADTVLGNTAGKAMCTENVDAAAKQIGQPAAESVVNSDVSSVVEDNSVWAKVTYGEQSSAQKDSSATPYYELYSLNPDIYRTYPTLDCGFSVRVTKRLMNNKIESVGDLLEQSDTVMLSISGFGANSLKEIHGYFEGLVKNGSTGISSEITEADLPSELIPYSHNLRVGDLAFAESHTFSAKSLRIIEQYREAHKNVDKELIDRIANNEPAALSIIEMLEEFVVKNAHEHECRAAIAGIPAKRANELAEFVFCAFSDNEELRLFFSSKSFSGATLAQFVYANADLVDEKNSLMIKFLKWCEFNVISEIEAFFDSKLVKDNVRRIFCGRVQGETLAQLGDEIGITRERVRQIEAKIVRISREWFLRNRVVNKLFLDLGYESSVSSTQIMAHVGRYGAETVFLLKECSGKDFYYDERLDLFSLGKPIDSSGIQDYIDSLPDLFVAEKLDGMIYEGIKKFNFPEEILRTVFDSSYRRTGDTYHRSRLTLANVYEETMKKYYPSGIHIDDAEIERFKQLAQSEFGVDLSDKSTHSVSSIITRISILCGRGRYQLKSDSPCLSEKLTEQIRNYVANSTMPVIMLNSIFSEFEDELREEGISNRYHLQGILKELFGDTWYFKRDYIATNPEVTSFYKAVGSFIAKATSPVSKEEVMRQFPGITDIVINLAISGSDTINLFGAYINVSRLTLLDDDVQYFHKKLEEALAAGEICYAKDLYNAIRSERPGLLSRNFITSGFGLYSVLEYLFGDDYNFSRPFIAGEGTEIKSIISALKEIVAEAEVIEISDITSFAAEHNYIIQRILDFVNSCNETHLMINSQELATLEYIGANESIAQKIEALILAEVSEAVPISHLTCIDQFPKLKVEWNSWLIYSFLKKWSKKLDVGTSKSLFKTAYPVVAPAGASLVVEFDESISHNGELMSADNLDNIDDLIADYITTELGDIDEL